MSGLFVALYHQSQPFDLPAVLCAGRHDIDASGINAAVAQDVRQFRNILFNTVESAGE